MNKLVSHALLPALATIVLSPAMFIPRPTLALAHDESIQVVEVRA